MELVRVAQHAADRKRAEDMGELAADQHGLSADRSAAAGLGTDPAPPAAVIAQAQKEGLNTNLPFHNLDSDVQSDGLALRDKFNQNVRYQILMNQDTFSYIVNNSIYNVNGQQAMAQADKPTDFPPTAFELKTSWIWIGTNQSIFNQLNGKYYIVNAYYALVDGSGKPNGGYKVGRAALSGMHIISKPMPQWFWTTFQNVYDAQYTQATNKLPMSPAATKANQKYRAALKEGGFDLRKLPADGHPVAVRRRRGQADTARQFADRDRVPAGVIVRHLSLDRELFGHQRLLQHRQAAERRDHLLHRQSADRADEGLQPARFRLVPQARAVAALARPLRPGGRTGANHERSFPSAHLFPGFMCWDPATGNNNDYFPTYDDEQAALNWAFFKQFAINITPANFQTTFRPWAIASQTINFPSSQNPTTGIPGEWNYFGGNGAYFVQYSDPASGIDRGADHRRDDKSGQSVSGDPLIGKPVTLLGDPFGDPQPKPPGRLDRQQPGLGLQQPDLFQQHAIGDGTVGFTAPRAQRMQSRFINFTRNFNLPAPAARR